MQYKQMKVRFKKLSPEAVMPRYAHDTDAGMDLTATRCTFDEDGNVVYHTDLAMEIPDGYVGLVFPRSSICRQEIFLTNAVGVIDSGYRGEVTAKFKPTSVLDDGGYSHAKLIPKIYKPGDRIAQLIILPYPHIEPQEATTLATSDRGTGGYGSTGE